MFGGSEGDGDMEGREIVGVADAVKLAVDVSDMDAPVTQPRHRANTRVKHRGTRSKYDHSAPQRTQRSETER